MQDKLYPNKMEVISSPRDLLKTFNFGKPKAFSGHKLKLKLSNDLVRYELKREMRNLDSSRILKVIDLD